MAMVRMLPPESTAQALKVVGTTQIMQLVCSAIL